MDIKIGDYYDLNRNNKKTILSRKEENGYEDQYFEKEEIKWVVLDKNEETGEVLLISERPINQELYLQGKKGYDNAINILDKLCQEISGIEDTRNLTFEDIINSKYWDNETKKDLIWGKERDYNYWLGSRYVDANTYYVDFGVRYVYNDYVNSYDLFYSNGYASSNYYGVRPAVSIKV